MMRCGQCNNFIKTYDGEGWCSHTKYSGIVMLHLNEEFCRGHGYIKGSESALPADFDPEETPHKL